MWMFGGCVYVVNGGCVYVCVWWMYVCAGLVIVCMCVFGGCMYVHIW